MKNLRMLWTLSLLVICPFLSQLVIAQVSGSGTTNYIPIWTSSTAIGSSKLFQTGGNVGIGTTSPAWALDVNGHVNASKSYKIAGTDVLAIPWGNANQNTAVGYLAPTSTNNSAFDNTAVGYQALETNTDATSNTAVGAQALYANTSGYENTAVGSGTMNFNTTGNKNAAFGTGALAADTTGSNNTAVGWGALGNTSTASNNIGVGFSAGLNLSGSDSNNIEIGNSGVSTDNGVIRIGTTGTQTSFFAAGIYGVSSLNNEAIPVLVDSSGELVTASSSRRFKEDIHDMGDASRALMHLRPVTFRYKKPLDDGSQPIQYGLIAEEVAEVYPDLVSYSTDGQVQSVKYQLLDPMLLNEVQRQHAEIGNLQEKLQNEHAEIDALHEELRKIKDSLATQPQLP